MKNSVKVFITVTVDHIDCTPALLCEIAELIRHENKQGVLIKEDGDKIEWKAV